MSKIQRFLGFEGSIPSLACSPSPAKDLGIWRLEETLKVAHSRLPSMQAFPLKPSQQVANPHIRLNASREGESNLLLDRPDCSAWYWWWALKEKKKQKNPKKLSNNCSVWQTSCLKATDYFHGAALTYSGMCRVKKKKITISWYAPFQIPIPTLMLACQDST